MLADELQNLIMLDNMYSWLEAKLFQLKMSELKEAKFKSLFPERGKSPCGLSQVKTEATNSVIYFQYWYRSVWERERTCALHRSHSITWGGRVFFYACGTQPIRSRLKGQGSEVRAAVTAAHSETSSGQASNAALGSDLWLLHRFQDYLLGLESWFVIRQRIVNYWGWLGGKRWGNWL